MNREINIVQISIIILASFIIGFSFKGLVDQEKNQYPNIIEKNVIEKCQCSGLTREDVELIVRQEFVDAFLFNYAVDGAMGNPKLVPLVKEICGD